jgi:hypothetical protein
MIDMGMGEYQGIHGGAVTGSPAVEFKRRLAFALEKPTVKHYAMAIDVNDMLGACHGFCCAMKCYFHYFSLIEGF